MPLLLREINPKTDFPPLARCLFESHEDPPQKFFHVFFPIHTSRETAISEAATRLQRWHAEDPASYWQKVIDSETGELAGGAMWKIYHDNPFAAPPNESDAVTWFPDDGSRAFAEAALEKYSMPRARVASKAHVYLFVLFTHPSYRRKGVGQQFMDWGIAKADALGYDLFLESTAPGRPLYEANGLRYVEEVEVVVRPETKTEEMDGDVDGKWREMGERVGKWTFWLMWRPVGGKEKIEEGVE